MIAFYGWEIAIVCEGYLAVIFGLLARKEGRGEHGKAKDS